MEPSDQNFAGYTDLIQRNNETTGNGNNGSSDITSSEAESVLPLPETEENQIVLLTSSVEFPLQIAAGPSTNIEPRSNIRRVRTEQDYSNGCILDDPSRKRARVSENNETAPISALDSIIPTSTENDDDGRADDCIICFDAIDVVGDHRACCLRCGHIFGKKCIEKWLDSQRDREKKVCPDCKQPAKSSDVRVLYTRRTVRFQNNTEMEEVKKELQSKNSLLQDIQSSHDYYKTHYTAEHEKRKQMESENKGLQRVIAELQNQIGCSSSDPSYSAKNPQVSSPQASSAFHAIFQVSVDFKGNSGRVMAQYAHKDMLVISQKLQAQQYGSIAKSALKLVNCVDFKASELMSIRSSMIRDISVHNGTGNVLVGSMDGSVVVANLNTKSIIHEFREEVPIWSCAWNMEDSRFFYCGLQNGRIGVFDMRKTSERVSSLEFSTRPVIQLAHLERRTGHNFPLGGLLASSNNRCGFFHSLDSDMLNYKNYDIIDSGVLYSTAFDRSTRLVSCSFRPDKANRNVRHRTFELQHSTFGETKVFATDLHTIPGGLISVQMSRTALFSSRSGSSERTFFVAADDNRKSVLIWDVMDKNMQEISVGEMVLDICPFVSNGRKIMAVLLEKSAKIYRFDVLS